MYGYVSDYEPLTIGNILLRVSQEDIFFMLLGEKPDVKKNYLSLVREDNEPNCNFAWHNGMLLFLDFGNVKTHLDCFGVIAQREGLTFKQSLNFVNIHFKLGLEGYGELTPPKLKLFKRTESIKSETTILFKPRPFNLNDKIYWEQYGIGKDELLRDSVLPVLWYKFYSIKLQKTVIIRPKKVTYAYYEFAPRVKIYSPYMPKKKGKWLTNTTINDIGGVKHLPKEGESLVITKSYKDNRCLSNFGLNSVWFQNEGMIPSKSSLMELGSRFGKIPVLFDNDAQGIMAAKKVVQTINSYFPNKAFQLNVPITPNVSDPSDMYAIEGKIELLKFLATNNLL
jgi:hypothetical protein